MIKMIIKVKYPKISYIIPYQLSEDFSEESKAIRIDSINSSFLNIKRWYDATRNYYS